MTTAQIEHKRGDSFSCGGRATRPDEITMEFLRGTEHAGKSLFAVITEEQN